MDVNVKISREDWYLLAHLLFCNDREKQRIAFKLLQTEYADKEKRLELKELYKTNLDEYRRVQKMTDVEYMQRLHDRFSH
jgi:hypothetical protein